MARKKRFLSLLYKYVDNFSKKIIIRNEINGIVDKGQLFYGKYNRYKDNEEYFKDFLLKKLKLQLAEWDNNPEIREQIKNYLQQFNKDFLYNRVIRICEVDAPLFFFVSI